MFHRHRRALASRSFVVALTLSSAAAVAADVDVAAHCGATPVTDDSPASHAPAWSAALLDALTADDDRAARLAAALEGVPPAGAGDPLVARARVTLAALELQRGAVDGARQQLRRMPLDSDATLDAGLLMAESWAVAGDLATAVQWNLRVLHRWPDEPAAIDAVVQRASALGEVDRSAARRALGEARRQARQAAADIRALAAQLERDAWFDAWLAEGRQPPLDARLLPVFYRALASDAFHSARGRALASQEPALCARARHADLVRLQHDLERTAVEIRQTLDALEQRHDDNHRRFDQQRARYLTDGGRNAALGRQVNVLRNALARDDADIATLRSALDGLPAARQRLALRARQLATTGARIHDASREEVLGLLRGVLADREARLRDLAGLASLRLGDLQDPRTGR